MNTACFNVIQTCFNGVIEHAEIVQFAEAVLQEPSTRTLKQMTVIKLMELRLRSSQSVRDALIPVLRQNDISEYRPLLQCATPEIGRFFFIHCRLTAMRLAFSITASSFELNNFGNTVLKQNFESDNVPEQMLYDVIGAAVHKNVIGVVITIPQEMATRMDFVGQVERIRAGTPMEQIRIQSFDATLQIYIGRN